MKRGRKTSNSSGYIMNQHKNGKYFYAYTLRRFDLEDKFVYRRCQWGRLDENLKFIPALNFVLLPDEEKAKFVFPEDWDLSELETLTGYKSRSEKTNGSKLSLTDMEMNPEDSSEISNNLSSGKDEDSEGHKDRTGYIGHEGKRDNTASSSSLKISDNIVTSVASEVTKVSSSVEDCSPSIPLLCGMTWLIEIWSKKIGLRDDLFNAIGNNKELGDIVMSLMSYAMIFNNSLDCIAPTQAYMRYSTSRLLTEQVLGEASHGFTDHEFESFFKRWVRRSRDGQIYAFDSTLTGDIHSDSDPLGIRGHVFRYGYDIENALKSEFIILYSITTGYPLCYLNYGEDNEDFPNYIETLKRFKHLDIDDFVLFTNRKYEGVHLQVDLLASEGLKLLMPMEIASPEMEQLANNIDVHDHLPTGMQWDEKDNVYFTQIRNSVVSGNNDGPDSRISLYYSPEKDIRDRMKIQRRITHMNENVESLVGQSNQVYREEFSNANNLIKIEYSPATNDPHFSSVKSGSINKKKVKELTNMCGFYALRSFNLDLNPKELTGILRFASEHKKDFGILKELLNLQRPYNNKEGITSLKNIIKSKRFILFLTRILNASFTRAFNSSQKLSKNFRDVAEMLMEMSTIRAYFKGYKLVECLPLTPKQKLIVQELHLDSCPGKENSEITSVLHKMAYQDRHN